MLKVLLGMMLIVISIGNLQAVNAGEIDRPLTFLSPGGDIDDEETWNYLTKSPPDLISHWFNPHFGYWWGTTDVPMIKEYQGKGVYKDIVATPEAIRRYMQALSEHVKRLHKLGIKFAPYICTIGIAGDHEKRSGWWSFYDRWEDYKEFGLGDKPPTDPIEWMQRTPSGSLQRYYPHTIYHYCPNVRF